MTRGTQFKFFQGDEVREVEGRHVGRVIAMFNWTVRVQWANGWKQDFEMDELVLVHRDWPVPSLTCGPATMAESPKAALKKYFANKE